MDRAALTFMCFIMIWRIFVVAGLRTELRQTQADVFQLQFVMEVVSKVAYAK